MPDMKDITQRVVCTKKLKLPRPHVDTCSERCYQALLDRQRQMPGPAGWVWS